MKRMIIIFLILSACQISKQIPVSTGYLVAVETIKPRKVNIQKLRTSENVDSLVAKNYGYAISGFNSDTLFYYSPYFRIETLNKTVYVEEKELIRRNGKIKLKKLKR